MREGIVWDLTPDKNYIIPDYSKPYIPMKYSKEFVQWDKAIFGDYGAELSKAHYMAVDLFLGGGVDAQAVCHRDFGKTTVLVKKLILFIATKGELPNFGKAENVIVFSATAKQAVDIVAGIKLMVSSSEKLSRLLKLATDSRGKPIADREDYVCWELPNGEWFHLQGRSAGSDLRGTTKHNKQGLPVRPRVVFFDDILKEETLTSEVTREKTIKWFFGSVTPALDSQKNRRYVVGTPMVEKDVINIVAEGSTFQTLKLPIVKEFPAEKLEIAWKERFTEEMVYKKYQELLEAEEEDVFYREYMLEINSRTLRVFKDEWIKYYSYEEFKREGKIQQMTHFTSVDVAAVVNAKSAHKSLITIGVDQQDNWYVLGIETGEISIDDYIEYMFRHMVEFQSTDLRGEKIGLQYMFNYILKKEMERRNIYFRLEFLKSNSKQSKHSRIMGLEERFKKRKIFLPNDRNKKSVDELVKQIKGYLKTGATTPRVDAIDNLANFNDEDYVYRPFENEMGIEELEEHYQSVYGE